MRRVLIVAPHFAPISAPDGQRARMLAPHLRDFGWEPHVLTVDPSAAAAPLETGLLETLPDDLPVTRVSAFSARRTRRFGLGNIAWRAWPGLRHAGDRLLSERRFDLVYFSTTQFACLPLGRIWQRRHRVPFVVDLQDPWRSDFVHAAGARPPGGWKYRFASLQARLFEPWTLRRCAGVVSVSPDYLDQLKNRYPWWNADRGTTIPMGWSNRDFSAAVKLHGPFETQSGTIRYLGRLGSDMTSTLEAFLAGLSKANHDAPDHPLRCEFRGGSYDHTAVTGPVRALATRFGVSQAVTEDPTRMPYFAALASLRTAGANLIFGSDDSGYAPSKIWLTLAAQRPWLALGRRGTVLHHLVKPHTGHSGWLVDPTDRDAPESIARFCREFERFQNGCADEPRLVAMEARELARLHAQFFENVCA